MLFGTLVPSRLEFVSVDQNSTGVTKLSGIEPPQKKFISVFYDRFFQPSVFHDYIKICNLIGLTSLFTRRMLRDFMFLCKVVNGCPNSPAQQDCVCFRVLRWKSHAHSLYDEFALYKTVPMIRLQLVFNKVESSSHNTDIYNFGPEKTFREWIDVFFHRDIM